MTISILRAPLRVPQIGSLVGFLSAAFLLTGATSTLAQETSSATSSSAEPGEATIDAPKTKLKKKPACEVVVMDLKARGLPPDQEYVAEILTNTMAAEIAEVAECKVITEADIASMMDFEATKAACGAKSDSCLAEIGNALGVDLVIGGVVGKLGKSFTFQAMLRNVAEGGVVARVNETIKGEPELLNHAAKNAGRALFKKELLPAPKPEVSTKKVAKNDGAEAKEGGGGGMMMMVGAGLMGPGLLLGIGGGLAAFYAETELLKHTETPDGKAAYEGFQILGMVGLGCAAVGATASIVGAGFGAMGMIE
ncbi:MAG: hypothetical protein GY822_19185 [Deltaproteobacteria bacterium]|nr:hypothetical protein [Deltaproteobacteria bacterium]